MGSVLEMGKNQMFMRILNLFKVIGCTWLISCGYRVLPYPAVFSACGEHCTTCAAISISAAPPKLFHMC